MLQEWQQGVVKKMADATPNTRMYWIELPKSEQFDFKPGQFVTLDLPISTQRQKRWRSYSIASAPNGNIIELVIVHVLDGAGTGYLFDNICVGDTIMLRGPQGTFLLPPNLDVELFMICTGTGIAPFRSMLQHIYKQGIPFKKINLVFGTRLHEDLLYEQEMRQLELDMPGFHYLPTLSRQTWEGHKGYVHGVYEALCANRQEATFMLCGWRAMADEAHQKILEMGYTKKDIIAELYG